MLGLLPTKINKLKGKSMADNIVTSGPLGHSTSVILGHSKFRGETDGIVGALDDR
jgi:hypothetical protein